MRSRQPSRLEGFSDAVFGFALTLLVVTVDVPRTFDDLMVVVRGFLPFAFTFATIAWLWYEHYAFFRCFDADDRLTIVLNCALLFMVLFYVYPLKFLYTLVVNMWIGLPSFEGVFTREGDGVRLMTIYGLGFAVVFATLALMYANVLRRRRAMNLTVLEAFDARRGIAVHAATAAVGLLSIGIALIGGDGWAAISGMSYALLGVVHGVLGWLFGRKRGLIEADANLVM